MKPAVFSESRAQKFLNHAGYNYTGNSNWSVKASVDYNIEDVVSADSVAKTGYEVDRNTLSSLVSVGREIRENLNLNAMLRQDWVDGEALPLVPFLGFDYRLIKGKNLILKGNIARNYHRPTLNDLYWQPGGNPDLLPEKGITAEVGLEYQLTGKRVHLKSEATVYHSDIDNWIIWIPSFKGFWTPMNVKNVLAEGVEINTKLDGTFSKLRYILQAYYAYSSSKNYGNPLVWGDDSYGKQLVYVPLNSFNLLARISYNGFYVSWQHNNYSERYTTSSNDVSRRYKLYSYYMNDVVMGKDFAIGNIDFSTRLKVNNLFDETYHSILYRPMPRRNYQFLLMIKI